jgi:hypothetical protein
VGHRASGSGRSEVYREVYRERGVPGAVGRWAAGGGHVTVWHLILTKSDRGTQAQREWAFRGITGSIPGTGVSGGRGCREVYRERRGSGGSSRRPDRSLIFAKYESWAVWVLDEAQFPIQKNCGTDHPHTKVGPCQPFLGTLRVALLFSSQGMSESM